MTWHADPELLTAYALDQIDDARAFSLEAHLLACPTCREACARVQTPERLDVVWASIVDRIDRPAPRPFERLLRAAGIREHAARLIGATPSLQLSWITAIIATLGFGVLASHAGPEGPLLFMLIAPLIPVAGIATAFGPGADPTFEVGLAAPMRGFSVLMLRAVSVLTTSFALAGVAALALPTLGWTAAAWLLPSLALTSMTLVLSTFMEPIPAAAGLSFLWVVGVTLAERLIDGSLIAFGAEGQAISLVLTVVGGLLLVARKERFETEH